MATSFRRKKHQDERASEASDFLCTRFQMCTKHLETVATLGNHFMFLQMVEEKGKLQPLRNRSKLDSKFSILFNHFQVQEFSSVFHIQLRLHDQVITMNQGKMCFVSEYRQL